MGAERNVGGSDLLSRVFACVVIAAVAVVPFAQVQYHVFKLSLLIATELGLLCLMLGMFFKAKTYSAGLQLFFTPLAMLGLAHHGVLYVPELLGMVSVGLGGYEIIMGRSLLNQLLGISSFKKALP